MKGFKVIDNFLTKEEHQLIVDTMIYKGGHFCWYYCDNIYKGEHQLTEDYTFALVHFFKLIEEKEFTSPFKYIIDPILKRLNINEILRVKSNLYSRTENLIVHGMHEDFTFSHKGLLYFVNTNDGFTELYDGTKVESVENRALLFDPSLPHTSTNCTDQKFRSTIIFNFK